MLWTQMQKLSGTPELMDQVHHHAAMNQFSTWIDDVFEKEGGLYSMLSNPGPYVIWIDFDKGTY